MPAPWIASVALALQIATPAAPARLLLPAPPAIEALAPARGPVDRQQTAAPPSKRRRILTGALIGFGVGAALGLTVGQESCLNQSKWVCAANGGGVGAGIGALIGWW